MRILFIFVFLSPLVYGQSKKAQIEILNKRLDSLNYRIETERNQYREQTNKANRNLQIANETIAKSNQKVSKMKLILDSNKMSNIELNKEIKLLKIKYDSLVQQLDISSQNQNKTSYVSSGYNPEQIKPLDIQNEFDFEYVYRNGNGFNPPIIFPIGWSYNGNIAYKEDYCGGGCGCCATAIVVRDLKSNKTLKTQRTNLMDYMVGEVDHSIWSDNNYCNSFSEIIKDYNIIPIGLGNYSTSNVIEKDSYNNSYTIEIILEKQKNTFELKTKMNGHSSKSEYLGNLKFDDHVTMHTETDTWGNVEYVGHFISSINNYAAIALMHSTYGYEGEIDYEIEFIGIELPEK